MITQPWSRICPKCDKALTPKEIERIEWIGKLIDSKPYKVSTFTGQKTLMTCFACYAKWKAESDMRRAAWKEDIARKKSLHIGTYR